MLKFDEKPQGAENLQNLQKVENSQKIALKIPVDLKVRVVDGSQGYDLAALNEDEASPIEFMRIDMKMKNKALGTATQRFETMLKVYGWTSQANLLATLGVVVLGLLCL